MYFGLAGVTKNTFEVHDIKISPGKCLARVSVGQMGCISHGMMGNSMM